MKKKRTVIILLTAIVVCCGCADSVKLESTDKTDLVATIVQATIQTMNNAQTKISTEKPTQTPTVVSELGTRGNPVPLGQPLQLIYQETASFQVSILEVVRGSDAQNQIAQANMFNEPAPQGMEYMLVKIGVNYLSSSQPDQLLSIGRLNFKSVSKNQMFDPQYVVISTPELEVNLFPGGYGEGYVVLLSYAGDPTPLVVFSDFLSTTMFYFAVTV
jgi:hypothetical protein